MNCKLCARPLRPNKTRRDQYPGTVIERVVGKCATCAEKGEPPRTYWNGKELLEEVAWFDGPAEEKLRRLNTTAHAVLKAAYRHGRPELAREFVRLTAERAAS